MTNLIRQKATILAMRRSTSYTLIALIITVALFYMYFANITVRTLTTLEKTKQQMQSLSVEVSEMESKRLTIENDFSTEKALGLGFVEVNHPIFIMKSAKKTALSFKID
jgi:hypothetical protein